jgi:hypothetical protein
MSQLPPRDRPKVKRSTQRYSAKVLFGFRYGDSTCWDSKCLESIYHYRASSPREAIAKARRFAKSEEVDYMNTYGERVRYEFLGILDMIRLGGVDRLEEVWSDVRERNLTAERVKRIIPSDADLLERID